ncbi:RIFT barrel domain-containing protein, partial [Bacillus paralicheniformis]
MKAQTELKWLNRAPAAFGGVTWGVPWAKGVLQKGETVAIASKNAPCLQTWPLAYWPDGSLKWTGHAAVFPKESGSRFTLKKGGAGVPKTVMNVSEQKDEITVNTGAIVCRLGKSGTELIRSISISGEMMAKEGRLIALKEKRSGSDSQCMYHIERFESMIKRTAIEQNGPVKTVVKIEGVHRGGG